MSDINKESWICKKCGTSNTANFCTVCGTRRPETIEPDVIEAEIKEKTTAEPVTLITESKASETPKAEPVKPAAPKSETKAQKAQEVKTVTVTKRANPWVTALVAGIVGVGAGFGGGYLAVKNYAPEPQVVVQQAENTPAAQTATQEDSAKTPVVASSSSTSLQDVIEEASKTVVEIQTENTETAFTFGFGTETYTSKSAGSGVIITEDGYIITNNHVVSGSEKITVTTYDGMEYEASLIGTDEKTDIAVIKIEATGLHAAAIGDSDTLRAGDTAIVIGNPLGTLGGTVTSGIISATNRDLVINNQAMNLIQTNATINSGNSGGGLFNDRGELVGIVNAKDSGTTSSGAVIEGIGFAIPVNTAYQIAKDLMENGYVSNRATIGVGLSTLSSDYYDRTTGETLKAGLYISKVYDGSGAQSAGLQEYDRIVSAEGTQVSSYTDLTRILNTKNVGDTLELEIERDGELSTYTIELTGPLSSMNE